ncbi:CDP-alcohol phosphatidyltransferase family protein [Verrucomicrobiaceae bacterium N1E253]|uniref:CDP-diacylglycerol--glycerol-3-phosphate 3-phosphatidyltransferase n=1 Tax=Oceaniferula marina TaxID=2748318 RepID=A0A851GH43_9BACT|nr:CDP-alcohol phosphatidyltransferase family protein [Oceaniferula marina]NWK57108.1 CDP-alcohol phosphatidyltransferase family protein [Oceaniferula marina]
MTFASLITLTRIALVPVFAVFAVLYSQSVQTGAPEETLRWLAIITFIVAAASDGLDGFIARHFNQCSEFGAFIDPIADKLLMLTGIITLSFAPWGENQWQIAPWFATLVIARDIIILGGIVILYYLKRRVPIRPSWIGKTCTVTQMTLLAWVMLKIELLPLLYPTILAAIFTLWSGIFYVQHGFQINANARKAI